MVKAITVECPCCHDVWELYLTSNAFLIILNCPKCFKTLLYHHNTCSLIDQRQIRQLQMAEHEDALKDILKGIISGSPHITKVTARIAAVCARGAREPVMAHSLARDGAESITQDDITNLRIQLETCKDVMTFIKSI